MSEATPGYTYGTAKIARSPVSLAELGEIRQSLLLGDEDIAYLKRSRAILEDQIEAILDVWYGFVGSTPHLVADFSTPDGKPIEAYLAAVRKRFAHWIIDTASADYDQAWLDYQHEIGLRHHRIKKNVTDGADSTAIIPFRHLIALTSPITFTLRPFLAAKGDSVEDVDKMYGAWIKSTLLQVILWSHPYIREGDF